MNNSEIVKKINISINNQIQRSGVVVPTQVMVDLGILAQKDFENWRFGKIDYLERVCKINLSKLSLIMKEIKKNAVARNLKSSETFYKRWGLKDKTKKIKLLFSKSGDENIEKSYSTHYIDLLRINAIKLQKQNLE